MIFYKGNGKKECELSKSQLCPARSNRRPLLVRLSLYLPFPAAFPRKFPFSFSFRIFYLRIFCFIPDGFFFPRIFAHFFLFFAILVFIFCPSVLLSANKCFLFFCDYSIFICPSPPRIDICSVRMYEKDALLLFNILVAYCNCINFEMKIIQREKTKN